MIRPRGNAAITLTPERQRLAEAIRERDEAKAALDTLTAAADDWGGTARQAVRKAEAALEAATAAIETAGTAAADYLLAGSAGLLPATVGDARAAQQVANDNLLAAQSALQTLQSRVRPAEQALEWKETKVRDAVTAAIKASPEMKALLDEAEAAVNALWRHGAALEALWKLSAVDTTKVEVGSTVAFSRGQSLRNKLHDQPMRWQGLPRVDTSAWEQAFRALHVDATAELPAL
jgi:hypothetical protein